MTPSNNINFDNINSNNTNINNRDLGNNGNNNNINNYNYSHSTSMNKNPNYGVGSLSQSIGSGSGSLNSSTKSIGVLSISHIIFYKRLLRACIKTSENLVESALKLDYTTFYSFFHKSLNFICFQHGVWSLIQCLSLMKRFNKLHSNFEDNLKCQEIFQLIEKVKIKLFQYNNENSVLIKKFQKILNIKLNLLLISPERLSFV
ncbi:unnamed protein product [[Candida] boidinii]|uniref:Unnamed protein product n=1 Tax=Candida boidinii TaxID=5477 RepID=A0A9W6SYG2_CANBO|nr:unnamed protein product [[Candida] boidinii]